MNSRSLAFVYFRIIGKSQGRVKTEEVDQILNEKTTGGLRMFDGTTLLGSLNTAGHLRQAIATETQVYTLAEPPKFFGKGSVGQ